MNRRAWLATIAASPLALTLGCQNDNFRILGYTTAPPFDENVKTVYVPVFKNIAIQTSGYRELEVDLTKAVIDAINARTPMRVTSDRDSADSELLGTLVKIEKNVQNRNQQNQVREGEVILTMQIVWRDIRTGKVLSNRRPPPGTNDPAIPFDPTLPPPDPVFVKEVGIPVQLRTVGRLLPELGESTATANQMATNKMAVQIVNMMEAPW
jgi:hypothetical protein